MTFAGDVALRPSPLYQESGGVTTEIYHNTFDDFGGNVTFRGKVGLRVASETGGEEESFFGKMKDGGTITVADQATCDLIKSGALFTERQSFFVRATKVGGRMKKYPKMWANG